MESIRMNKLLFFCILLLSVSCKKQEDAPDMGYNYFGLIPGRYVDYDVMEIDHDITQFIQHDTMRYQLRTVIGDTIIDNSGRIARRFYRYKRQNTNENWSFSDLYTAIVEGNRAEIVEENQRVIKLVFAVNKDNEWNMNAFNLGPNLTCRYINIGLPFQINNLSFSETVRVEQEDFTNSFVDFRRKHETYAKDVGLIQKYYKDLKINNKDSLNIKSGKELFYNCIGYGMQ